MNRAEIQALVGSIAREIREDKFDDRHPERETVGTIFQKIVAKVAGYEQAGMISMFEAGSTKPGLQKLNRLVFAYQAPEMLKAIMLYYLHHDSWKAGISADQAIVDETRKQNMSSRERLDILTDPKKKGEFICNYLEKYSQAYRDDEARQKSELEEYERRVEQSLEIQ